MPTLQRNSSLAFWKSVGIILGPRYSSEQDHIYHTAIKRPCITSQSHVKPIHFGNGQTTSECPNLLFKCRGRIGRNSEAVASDPKNGFRSTTHLPELLPGNYPVKVMRDCTIPYD